METLDIVALLLTLAAIFSYLNYRFIKLPTVIGIMLISILMSLGFILLDFLKLVNIYEYAGVLFKKIDFNKTLLHGMLSFLLFAGSIHISLEDIAKHKWVIGILSTISVVVSGGIQKP